MSAAHWPVSVAEYHADLTRDSHSTFQLFRYSVRAYYEARVLGLPVHRDSSAELEFGTAFHMAVMQADRFSETYAVMPATNSAGEKWDMRFKAHKAEMQEVREKMAGKTLLDAADYDLINRMADGLHDNHLASQLLLSCEHREYPIAWSYNGLPMRSMLDACTAGTVVDIKTTADPYPDAFLKSVVRYGYHCQADLYIKAAMACLGLAPMYYILACGKETGECFSYRLSNDFLALAHDENERVANEISNFRKFYSGDIPWTSKLSTTTTTLEPPGWLLAQGKFTD